MKPVSCDSCGVMFDADKRRLGIENTNDTLIHCPVCNAVNAEAKEEKTA